MHSPDRPVFCNTCASSAAPRPHTLKGYRERPHRAGRVSGRRSGPLPGAEHDHQQRAARVRGPHWPRPATPKTSIARRMASRCGASSRFGPARRLAQGQPGQGGAQSPQEPAPATLPHDRRGGEATRRSHRSDAPSAARSGDTGGALLGWAARERAGRPVGRRPRPGRGRAARARQRAAANGSPRSAPTPRRHCRTGWPCASSRRARSKAARRRCS